MVENLPAMQEAWVQSLSQEDPLEESIATHSSILAWRISMDRGAWWATVQVVAQSWTRLSNYAQAHKHTITRTHTCDQQTSATLTSIPATLSLDIFVEDKGSVLFQMPFFSMTAVSDDGISFSMGGFLHLDFVHSWGKYVCSLHSVANTALRTMHTAQGSKSGVSGQSPSAPTGNLATKGV